MIRIAKIAGAFLIAGILWWWGFNLPWDIGLVVWAVSLGYIMCGVIIAKEEEPAMAVMTNGTNGVHKEEGKQDTIHVVTLSSSEKLYDALGKAPQWFGERGNHLDTCVGLHCHAHGIFFPAFHPETGTRECCLPSHYIVFAEWPRTIMCRTCADIVKAVTVVKPPFENWLFR